MRLVAALSAFGALLGVAVSVADHFTSRVLASTFAVTVFRSQYYAGAERHQHLVNRAAAVVSPRLVHPSWWPTLPVTIVTGILVGALLGLLTRLSSRDLVRSQRQEG